MMSSKDQPEKCPDCAMTTFNWPEEMARHRLMAHGTGRAPERDESTAGISMDNPKFQDIVLQAAKDANEEQAAMMAEPTAEASTECDTELTHLVQWDNKKQGWVCSRCGLRLLQSVSHLANDESAKPDSEANTQRDEPEYVREVCPECGYDQAYGFHSCMRCNHRYRKHTIEQDEPTAEQNVVSMRSATLLDYLDDAYGIKDVGGFVDRFEADDAPTQSATQTARATLKSRVFMIVQDRAIAAFPNVGPDVSDIMIAADRYAKAQVLAELEALMSITVLSDDPHVYFGSVDAYMEARLVELRVELDAKLREETL